MVSSDLEPKNFKSSTDTRVSDTAKHIYCMRETGYVRRAICTTTACLRIVDHGVDGFVRQQTFDIKFSLSNFRQQTFDVKFSVSNLRQETFDMKCSVSSFRQQTFDTKVSTANFPYQTFDNKLSILIKPSTTNFPEQISTTKSSISNARPWCGWFSTIRRLATYAAKSNTILFLKRSFGISEVPT